MSERRIVEAVAADLPRITEIYNSTIPSRTVTADTVAVTVESRQAWFDAHTSHHRPIWVLRDTSDTVVGWMSFEPFKTRPAYDATVEISIYIDESQRGTGAGRQLLQYAHDVAPSLGVQTLAAYVVADNTASLALLDRFGFERWGFLPDVLRYEEGARSLVIAGKHLGDNS